jgi:predicted transposase YbfD/YdcC
MKKSSCFIEYFEDIPEYRQEGKVHHLLTEILFISVAATLANAIGWTQVEEFAIAREEWLKKFLTLPYGIPSHDTFERVNEAIDPVQFSKCFAEWTRDIAQRSDGAIIAVDGKTSRGSFDNQLQKGAIHIVNAWISSNSLILGQLKTSEKSNEITAIPELLDMLFVKGCIITIDAMGCQRDIAEKIIDKKADYVLAVKGNQPTLMQNIVDWFDLAEQNRFKDFEHDTCKTYDKGHGRIEKRKYYITEDIEWLAEKSEWKGLKSIGMAIRENIENDRTTVERRYYISSLKADAKTFAKAVRSHWGVESTHWILDMVFKEDQSRERKNFGPENKSLLNKVALNLLKQDTQDKKKISLTTKRYKASMDVNYLENILFGKSGSTD